VPKPPSDIPLEVQQQLLAKLMERHWRKWLTEKIPALAEKPRNRPSAARKARNKSENSSSHSRIWKSTTKAGKDYYDFSWMWDELGIEKEEAH